jgi:pimeloyl-ACP methyl ester carboxylesterase
LGWSIGRGSLLGVGAVLSSIALAGCLGSSGPPPTTVVTTTTSAVTTTTTTLPSSVGVGGTTPSGAMSFLGQIQRIPVVEPILGSALLPPAPTAPGAVLPSIQIAYRQFGSGPNLLLVMGQRGTMTWWDPQFLAALSSKYSVTIFDLPGVGYSQPTPAPPTLATYADETAGLIVALGLAKTSLRVLGWGLGGDVALEADIRHPGLITALSLVDSPALGASNVRSSALATAAFASTTDTTVRLSELLFPPAQGVARADWLQQIGQLAPDDETAAAVNEEGDVVASLATPPQAASELRTIKIPVQVIFGADDELVPTANSVALSHQLSHSKLYSLPDAGYASFASDQTRFLAILSGASS